MSVTMQSLHKVNNLYNIPLPPEPGDFSTDSLLVVGTPTTTKISFSAVHEDFLLEATATGTFEFANGLPKTAADLRNTNSLIAGLELKVNGLIFSMETYSPQVNLKLQDDATTLVSAAAVVFGGDDTFIGALNPGELNKGETIDGFGGNDVFYGNGIGSSDGNDIFYGGEGVDTSVYRGSSTSYTVKAGAIWNAYTDKSDLTGYIVTDKTGLDGTQMLAGVERLKFKNGTLALDFAKGENGYKAAMLIGAAFGKDKVSTYFAPAVGLFDDGMTTDSVAQLVIDLGLIESSIGSASNKSFVNAVYKNVAGVAPDSLTEALLTNYLDKGSMTKASLLSLAAGVGVLEEQINLTGLQSEGLLFISLF